MFGFVFLSACAASDGSRKSDAALSNHDPRTAVQLRTALKRLKEIMEGKSQVFTSLSYTFTNTRFAVYNTARNTLLRRIFDIYIF